MVADIQEIPEGYKRTEVGVIPQDWKANHFGDVLTIKHGKSQSLVIDMNGQYPIMATGGQIGLATDYLHKGPSVLIGRKGTIDKPRYVNEPFWTVDTLFYSEIKSPNIPKFLFYQACMVPWRSYNEASGVPSLNANTIENIYVAIPCEAEQEAIAEALTDADEAIRSLEAVIEKKRNVKQATLHALLTPTRRLPGFSGAWVEKTFDDVLSNIYGGGTPSKNIAAFWNGSIYWATIKDITNFEKNKTQQKITKLGLKSSSAKIVPAKILIIGTRMAVGIPALFDIEVAINQDLKALIFKNLYSNIYFFHWFTFQKEKLEAVSGGSTVSGISGKELGKTDFLIPPTLKEQTAIATILSDMDGEIETLEARLDKLRDIKQGMMQVLLTGKVRLI